MTAVPPPEMKPDSPIPNRVQTLSRFTSRLQGHLVAHAAILIPLAALIACAPRYLRGNSCGHDFDFHLVNWMEAKRAWSEGVSYPHWAQSPSWDAGEARFMLYPPLTWMLGALLGYTMKWDYVPLVLILICFIGSGFAMRALARLLLPEASATLAGVLAAATPYALFTAFERSAFAELAAAVWMPLLLWLAWRQPAAAAITQSALLETAASEVAPDGWTTSRPLHKPFAALNSLRRALDGSALPLALVLALTWLTNAPAGVMASYLLAFAGASAAILLRAWWPVIRAATAAAIGLAVAGFYLVPAAFEQRWVAIQQAVDVGMRIQDSWLFARHSSPDLELHDEVLLYASILLSVTVLAAIAGFFVARRRGRFTSSSRYIWISLIALSVLLVLMQFPVSTPLWHALPKLEFLQFPWRWLIVLDIPYCLFVGAAIPLASPRIRLRSTLVCLAALLALSAVSTLFFFQNCDAEDDVRNQLEVFDAGTGVDGTDEYAPAGADNSAVASDLPDACLVEDAKVELGQNESGLAPIWYPEQGSCDDTFAADIWRNEYKQVHVNADHAGYVVIRLRRYPAWAITVDDQPMAALPQREDGLVVVPVAAGPSIIEATWTITPDVIEGRYVSGAGLLAALLLALLEWRIRCTRRPADPSLLS